MTDQGRNRPGNHETGDFRPAWAKTLFRLSPWGLKKAINHLQDSVDRSAEHQRALDGHIDSLGDRVAAAESRLDAVEEEIRMIQAELGSLRDDRTSRLEERVDSVEADAAQLKDQVVPAAVERGNVLIDRLAEELEEVASLVERMALSEPIPVPSRAGSRQLAEALADVQPRLLEAFRGPEEEIRHRLDHHLPVLRDATPVVDLGCGRGELLLLLREAGIKACGVEQDPALVQAARRRGVEVIEGDALDTLRSHTEDQLGAVVAIHLLEHLEPALVLELLREARRVLRPGGVFLAECPNPHSLRVGAALYWCDPTHARPLLPETLELYFKSSGYEVQHVEYLHPFPEEQRIGSALGSVPPDVSSEIAKVYENIAKLIGRIDDLLNGPRDFAIVAKKP